MNKFERNKSMPSKEKQMVKKRAKNKKNGEKEDNWSNLIGINIRI